MSPMKSVLVTGGTKRIGKVIAETLRARGWNVLVASRTPGEGVLGADLAEPLGPARLYAQALAAAPDLCAIVNNAAVFSTAAALPPEEEARMRAVNVVAPQKLTMLLSGREGMKCAVVNVLDCRVLSPAEPNETPYAKTKRELLEYTHKSAGLFAESMRVNAVAPGPVLAPEGCHEKAGELLLDRRPTPADVAAAVLYLLEAEATTGAVIPVDAGQHLLYV